MWEAFVRWEVSNHVADISSIAGVILSVVGFGVTLVGVFASRSAAIRAEAAARRAVAQVRLFEEAVDFSFAISALEEIRRLHRLRQWLVLPDRYAALRRVLISIKSSATVLSSEQLAKIQSALASLESIERSVERGVADPSKLDPARFNNIIAKQIDNLQAILSELKVAQGDRADGKAQKAD